MIFKLEHIYVLETLHNRIFDKVNSVNQMVNAISNLTTNEAKGYAFEVFGEFFVKTFGPHPDIGLTDYHPNTDKDLGVDGFAKDNKTLKKAVIQFKFRQNPTEPLTYKELSTFGNDSLARHSIVSESAAEVMRKQLADVGAPKEYIDTIKSNMRNILIISTVRDTYYTWDEVNKGSRFIGIDHLRHLLKDDKAFWNDLRKSLESSINPPKEREPFPDESVRWEHQNDCIIKLNAFFENKEENKRGQIIIATGGGKTLLEVYSVLNHDGLLYVVMAPTIMLVKQLYQEFFKYKDASFDTVCVCSGQQEQVELYEGETTNILKPILDEGEIENKIKEALQNKKKLCFFSTYHSEEKLAEAVRKFEIQYDLVVYDEAHNLTSDSFRLMLDKDTNKYIKGRTHLFFTATRKIYKASTTKGMNNEEFFGNVIYKIAAADLIQRGIIVAPIIHLVLKVKETVDDADDIESLLPMVIEGIKKHKEISDNEARVIVFCRNAHTQPRAFLENKQIQDEFKDFYIAALVSDYVADSISGTDVKRKEVFERFVEKKFSIVFHYDIISEGIDFPGATAILVLRPLQQIKAIQATGRVLRMFPEDRENLKNGKIKVNDSTGWQKPFGYVMIPALGKKNESEMEVLKNYIKDLRADGFSFNIEDIIIPELPKSKRENDPFNNELDKEDMDSSYVMNLFEACKNIFHMIETEESVRNRVEKHEIDFNVCTEDMMWRILEKDKEIKGVQTQLFNFEGLEDERTGKENIF